MGNENQPQSPKDIIVDILRQNKYESDYAGVMRYSNGEYADMIVDKLNLKTE